MSAWAGRRFDARFASTCQADIAIGVVLQFIFEMPGSRIRESASQASFMFIWSGYPRPSSLDPPLFFP